MPPTVPRFFALVIGIDEYPGFPDEVNLEGACNDARNIYEWLSQDVLVGTDNSNIVLLLDKEATRKAIIENFRALTSNNNIQYGDPIFIYYAGHGGTVKTPAGWSHTAKRGDGQSGGESIIEVILSHDVYTPRDAPRNHQVQPIPDTTMNRLLRELATAKGDNITVIRDCCFSGGGTRHNDPDDENWRARYVDLYSMFDGANMLSDELDRDIMDRTRDLSFPEGDLSTHVLIAACDDYEKAYESPLGSEQCQGCFTRAFIQEVREWDDRLSYAAFMENFPPLIHWVGVPLEQTPQCIGANVDRIFFDGKLPARDPAFIRIHLDLQPNSTHLNRDDPSTPLHVVDDTTYTLHVGDADGIVQGANFTVHRICFPSDESELCTMTITEIEPFSATLVPVDPKPAKLPMHIYAKRAGWTEQQGLRIHCTSALEEVLDGGILTVSRPGHFDRETGLRFVGTKQDAVLVIDVEEGKAVLDYRFMDKIFRLSVNADPTHEQLLPLLHRAVCWNWDLTRGHPSVTNDVTFEFTRLRTIKAGFRAGELEPEETHLNQSGVVRLSQGENYGFTLANNLETDLHVKNFWFDTTLDIEPIYRGATSRKQELDPMLRANGVFQVGYGSPGVPCLTFWEASVGDTPLGFIRVFIQDRNSHIESIESSTAESTQPLSSLLTEPHTPVTKGPLPWYTITLQIIVQ